MGKMKQQAQRSLQTQQADTERERLAERAQTIRGQLEKWRPQIQESLVRNVKPEYVMATAMTALRTNPELLECTAASILAGIMQSVQLGLQLSGPLGHAYLLPFRNADRKQKEAQFVPGYRGLIDLAYRNPRIQNLVTELVREHDNFGYELGSAQKLRHVPAQGDRGGVTHVYAYANISGGGFVFVVLTKEQVEKRRAMSKAKDSPAWKGHWDKMARKTAMRDLFPYLPVTVEMGTAARLDTLAEEGIPQQLALDVELGQIVDHGEFPDTTPAGDDVQTKGSQPRKRGGPKKAETGTAKDPVGDSSPSSGTANGEGAVSDGAGSLFDKEGFATRTEALLKMVAQCQSQPHVAEVTKLRDKYLGEGTITQEQADKVQAALENREAVLSGG
jgi:recombination protein RecT